MGIINFAGYWVSVDEKIEEDELRMMEKYGRYDLMTSKQQAQIAKRYRAERKGK